MVKKLKLRAHHINCIYFYKGLGYSEEFVKSMNEIVYNIRNNDNTKFELINCCDELCKACPNKNDLDCCNTDDKVRKLDSKTIEVYNLKVGHIYSFKFIQDNIYKNFSKEKFIYICNECEWYKKGVCKV